MSPTDARPIHPDTSASSLTDENTPRKVNAKEARQKVGKTKRGIGHRRDAGGDSANEAQTFASEASYLLPGAPVICMENGSPRLCGLYMGEVEDNDENCNVNSSSYIAQDRRGRKMMICDLAEVPGLLEFLDEHIK